MPIRARVLGAAAGGGLPQWNCAAPNSAAVWRGVSGAASATQSSIAVSVDGERWLLVNASPDLRQQIVATPALHPRPADEAGLRNSPIAAALLTNGDIDHVAGLLTLRERQPFALWSTDEIARVLAANPIFDALDRELVPRRTVRLGEPVEMLPGLTVELFAVPGKVPLYMEGETVATDLEGEQTVGVAFSDGARGFLYIPGCAAVTPALARRLQGADLVLFDGTVFHDDEMAREGVGAKTGRRMGHVPMAGPGGSLEAFAPLDVRRKIYIHINNTNPVWRADSAERRAVEAAGWEIAHDGMELDP